MPSFNAGTIESTSGVDRSGFVRDLQSMKDDAARATANPITLRATLDDSDARRKLDQLKAQLSAASGPSLKVNLDTSGAKAQIDAFKTQLAGVGAANVKVNLDTTGASAQLEALKGQLSSITGGNVRMSVEVAGSASAMASLSAIEELANRLDGRDITLRVNVSNAAANSALAATATRAEALSTLSPTISVNVNQNSVSQIDSLQQVASKLGSAMPGIVDAVLALGPALVPIAGAALAAAGGLAAMFAAGGAAAGVFGGAVLGAVKATISNKDALDKSNTSLASAQTAYDGAANAAKSAAAGVTSAQQSLKDAQAAVGDAATSAAKAVQTAKDSVVTAQQGVTQAVQASAKAVQSAKDNVVQAQQGVADAMRTSAQAVQSAKDNVVQAQQAVTTAVQTAAKNVANAQANVATSQTSVTQAIQAEAKAVRNAQDAVVSAQQGVAQASQQAAQAVQNAKDNVVQALQQQATAQQNVLNSEFSLSAAQDKERDAQLALTQSRVDAKRALEDMNASLQDAQLSERGDKLAVQEAQIALNQANAAGSKATSLQRQEAQLSYDEAVQHLNEQGTTTKRLAADKAKADKAGVEGSQQVKAANDQLANSQGAIVSASQQLTAAQQASANASANVGKAQKAVSQAQVTGNQNVQKAQDALLKSQQGVTDAQTSGALSVQQAQAALVKSQQAVTDAQVTGARSIKAAQDNVLKSQQAVTNAQTSGARTIKTAQDALRKSQQAVTDAQTSGAQQVAKAQKALKDAQQGVTDAQVAGAKQVAQAQQGVQRAQQGVAQAQQAAASAGQAAAHAAAALAAAQNKQSLAAKAFSPIERVLSASLTSLKNAYNGFIGDTEKQTLKPVITVVNALALALPKLIPIVRAVAPLAQQVADAFSHWVTGGGLKRAVDFIVTYGTPILGKFIDIVRNLLTTGGELVRQFAPLGLAIAGFLDKGSSSLAKWAQAGGFTDFLDKVKQVAPAVRQFFDALGPALANIGRALGDLGPASLLGVTGLLKAIAAVPPGLLAALIVGFLAFRTALKAYAVYQALATVATWAMTSSLIPFGVALYASTLPVWVVVAAIVALIAIIVAVGVGIYELVTHWKTVWGEIKSIASTVWGWMQIAFKYLSDFFIAIWNYLTEHITNGWNKVWNGVKKVASTIWGWLQTAFKYTSDFFITIWDYLTGHVSAAWDRLWGDVKQAASNVWGWLQTGVKYTSDFFIGIWNYLTSHISAAWHTLWGDVKNTFNTAWGWLKNTWSTSTKWVSDTWTKFLNGIKNFAAGIWRDVKGAANTFAGDFESVFRTVVSTVKTIWEGIKKVFKDPINVVIGFYNNGIAGIGNDILKAFGIKGSPIPKIKPLATGGPIEGGIPGKDSVPVLAMPGEHMLTTRDVDAMGGQSNVYAFRQALHMANGGAVGSNLPTTGVTNSVTDVPSSVNNKIPKSGGGILGSISGALNSVGGAIGGAVKSAASVGGDIVGGAVNFAKTAAGSTIKLAHKLVGGAVGLIIDPIINTLEKGVTNTIGKVGTLGGNVASGLNVGVLDKLKNWIDGKDSAVNAANSASGGQGGMYSSAGAVSTFDGVKLDAITIKQLKKAYSYAGKEFGLSQGSYSSGVAASAGTHSGGGALDVAGVGGMSTEEQVKTVKSLRQAGFAAWRRTPDEGFVDHIHAILIGDPTMSPQAAAQIPDYFAHKNGLAGHGKDDNPIDVAAGWFGSSAPSASAGGASVAHWLPQIQAALTLAHLPLSLAHAVEVQMQSESGGNPNAQNNTDVNAQHGYPSKGLMQVIQPTFDEFAGSLKSKGILDPEANIFAALNYARATYGPNLIDKSGNGLGSGHAYANGTMGAAPGWAQVGERGMEWVYMQGGETVLPHGVTPTNVKTQRGYAAGTVSGDISFSDGTIIPGPDVHSLSNLNTDIATIRASPSSAPKGELARLLSYRAQHFPSSTAAKTAVKKAAPASAAKPISNSTLAATISGRLSTATKTVTKDQKTVNSLQNQYDKERLAAAYEKNKYTKAADAAEAKITSAKLSQAKHQLTQAKQDEAQLKKDYKAATASSTAAAAAMTKAANATKTTFTTWLTTTQATVAAQLSAATDTRNGYLSTAQGAAPSLTGLNTFSAIASSFNGSAKTLVGVEGNIKTLQGRGVSSGLINAILGMAPADALAYTKVLLRTDSFGVKQADDAFAGYDTAAQQYATVGANVTANYTNLSNASKSLGSVTVVSESPKSITIKLPDGSKLVGTVETVEKQVEKYMTKLLNTKSK